MGLEFTAQLQVVSRKLLEHAALGDREARELAAWCEQAAAILNAPTIEPFATAAEAEAIHQVARWGLDHDRRKSPEDWFWALGWLGGKIVQAHNAGDRDKTLHRCVAAASLLANWHRHAGEQLQPQEKVG